MSEWGKRVFYFLRELVVVCNFYFFLWRVCGYGFWNCGSDLDSFRMKLILRKLIWKRGKGSVFTIFLSC